MSGIFKAYDIRGIYGKELDEKLAYKIGCAYVSFLKCKKIVIGKDMRKSGDKLFNVLAGGVIDSGCEVVDIGLTDTPMFYFAVAKYGLDGGIMVTASHNPKEYNGFKMTREKAIPISYDTGIDKIEELVSKNKLKKSVKKGKITKKDVMNDYTNHVLKIFNSKKLKKLKVVIDCGNGMGGLVTPKIFKKLNLEIIPLFWDLDGNFPNHEPNPLKPENIKDLRKKVKEVKADVGIAFDGDVDRVGFVDEKANYISGDIITALIAKKLLKSHPKEKIMYDLRSSWATKECILENGGKPILSRVGHSYIKDKMRKENALFAGELSSHFYFRDNFYVENAMGAALMILHLMSEENKSLSQLARPLQKYFSSGEINSEVKDKNRKLKEIEKKYKTGKTLRLDGLSVEFKDWWFNIRPSNTEPVLRLNVEAKSKKLMEEKRDELLKLIRG